jgi:hypothetical protein
MKYMLNLLLVIVATIKAVPFQVHAMGSAFLPLPEAPLELTFLNRMWDGQRLFLNFGDIVEMTP